MLFQEIDHIGYVRQAFEAGCLSSFLEIIENDILRNFDVSELLVYFYSIYKNYILSILPFSGGALYHFIFVLIFINIFRALLPVLEVFCGHFYRLLLHLMRSISRYQHLLHLMRSISRLFNFKEFIAF